MNKNFPKDFLFGAATAAYQVEGATNIDGKGKCIWDDWYKRPESKFNADIACDFYHLYPIDLKIGKEIGLQSIRISIAWSRIFPNNNHQINQLGINFYHKLIDECIKNGIEPVVTLHHFDSPQWVVDQGDFLNKQTINDYFEYAKVCFEQYGSKVKKWVTFNEPYVYNSDKYIYGESPPNIVGKTDYVINALHNINVAHALTVNYYKQNYQHEIGIVHVLQPKYPYDANNQDDVLAAHRATVLYSQFLLDANYFGYYSDNTLETINYLLEINNATLDSTKQELEIIASAKDKTDFLGINYYNPTWFVAYDGPTQIIHNADGNKGSSKFLLKGLGEAKTPEHIPTTEWDWAIYPQGLTDILVYVKNRYPNYNKIYITENGIGTKEELDINNKVFDDYRIDYQNDHLQAILNAYYNEQVNVKGYFVWSWQDMFSWTNGFSKRYGLYFVDFANQNRYLKLSAKWFEQVIINNTLDVDRDKIKQSYINYNSVNLKEKYMENILIVSDNKNINYKQKLINLLKTNFNNDSLINIIDFNDGNETNIVDTTINAIKKAKENYSQFKLIIIDDFGSASFMSASKFKGCIVAQLEDEHSARMTRDHNNTNIICLGSFNLSIGLGFNIAKTFVKSNYSGGRHQVRIDMLEELLKKEEC